MAAAFCAAALVSPACNVPVFRYALERWPAGQFALTVYNSGALNSRDQVLLDTIKTSADQLGANLAISVDDLNLKKDATQKTPLSLEANLPWAILRFPENPEEVTPIWEGPLSQLSSKTLLESPARASLVTNLLRGDSVVWLLLESGDRAQDEAVYSMLTHELKALEHSIELPPAAPDDPASRSPLPLRIAFSIERVAGHPGEDLFFRMLLHDEGVEAGKTAVVPVFGRGRALTALSGAELAPNIIRQAATFLCGACSCEVKELNPGKDLLLAARWDSIFETAAVAANSDPGSGPASAQKVVAGERVQIAPGLPAHKAASVARSRPNPRRGLKLLASTGLAITCIFVLLAGVVLLRSLRQR